ncbi:hypothetical protein [Clostridium sp. UBA6640]|uniref:hypothetical protein n=1 Tax=Clostridium sp. UBA6640 TaxID=1946370 RepID=UPI0025BB65B3|nr:hypothetical protein [Clostridium sp. UBA6640]
MLPSFWTFMANGISGNKVLSRRFISSEHTVEVFGESIVVYLENGVFHSAYGDFKLTWLNFGF